MAVGSLVVRSLCVSISGARNVARAIRRTEPGDATLLGLNDVLCLVGFGDSGWDLGLFNGIWVVRDSA